MAVSLLALALVATPHYVDFATADDLSAYLDEESPAGVLVSAHRGGPEPGFPENCLETFDNSMAQTPALIGTDVRELADGTLVLMHDSTWDRTTDGTGEVSESTLEDVRPMRLLDNDGNLTPYRIPTLDEALAWAEGRAVLQLDVKRGVDRRAVADAILRNDAADQALVIVYDLEAALEYAEMLPGINLSVSLRDLDDAAALEASAIDLDKVVAFTGVGTLKPDLVRWLDDMDVRATLGTFGDIDEAAVEDPITLLHYVEAGIDIIATDEVRAATEALRIHRSIH